MVPKVNKQGHSFKGLTAYLMHDPDRAKTSDRVAWFATGNMYTNDPHKAAKVMAWTDMNAEMLKERSGSSSAGRKAETGGVYHYSLSWAHGENPDQEHQRAQAEASLKHLGLETHEYVFVAHNDRPHAHMHIVVNLTNPETGKRAELGLDKRKIQAWALEYEKEHVMHCHMREVNARMREQEGAETYYERKKKDYGVAITRAYEASDDGKSSVYNGFC